MKVRQAIEVCQNWQLAGRAVYVRQRVFLRG